MKLGIDPDQVKGFLEKQEAESLYQFAKKYSSLGPCLEIGSYCGKSAVYLGAAVKENNQILYSIDHHKGSEEQQPGEEFFDPDLLDETGKGINTLPFFLETLDKSGLRDNVVPIVSTSVEANEVWSEPLAMVFIDGGHSDQAANDDYDVWHPHIIQGGLLAIHDVFPDPKDGGRPPFNIYTKAIESGLFIELEMIKSLTLIHI